MRRASAPVQRRASSSSKASPASSSTTGMQGTDDGDEFIRAKILLMGQRRGGKTSIFRVLFEGLNPKQAFFTEPTTRLTKYRIDTFIPLEIWDCPGTITIEQLGVPLSTFATIIFVADIQDSYTQPIARCIDVFCAAYQTDPSINLELFVHKAEAMSEDFRIESFKQFSKQLLEDLSDLPPFTWPDPLPSNLIPPEGMPLQQEPVDLPITLYLTSVYDHSLRDSFSRVFGHILQRTCLDHLENMLDAFVTTSHSVKAFLYDVQANFFVATDQSPVDPMTHGLCCDYVHMLNEFSGLFKSTISSPSNRTRRTGIPTSSPSSGPPSVTSNSLPSSPNAKGTNIQSPQNLSAAASRAPTPTHTAAGLANERPSSSASQRPSALAASTGSLRSNGAKSPSMRSSPTVALTSDDSTLPPSANANANTSSEANAKPKSKPLFCQCSSATLTPNTTLVYHQVTQRFALVALISTAVWESKRGLVEYNAVFFKEAVQEIYEVEQEARRRKPALTGGSKK